jgi:hypothetical protein
MKRMSSGLMTLAAAITVWLARPAAARAQSVAQPVVDLPPIELAAGVSFKRATNTAGAEPEWMGPDVSVAIGRHVSRHVAAAAQVETDFHQSTMVLGGAQLGTDFFYGSGRDPVPGRFIGRVLAGVVTGESGAIHPACQIAAGADILISRTRGTGVRWEAGFEFIAGAVPRHTNGRLAIGLVFGPHLHPQGRTTRR